MKIIMIIPAKAHSRRLPGKNIKPFAGHPLLAWSIVEARHSKHIDEIWVTTDSDEIREISEGYGANVLMRDYEDTDETPGGVPVENCCRRLVEMGVAEETDMQITRLCTTPTLLPGDSDRAIERWRWFHENFGAEGIGMAAELRTFHSQRKVVDGISRAINLSFPGLGADHQSENNYGIVQNLAFWSMNRVAVAMGKTTPDPFRGWHPHAYYYNLHPWQMQDVDTQEEFTLAEVIAEHYILKGRDMIEVYRNEE
jgi:Fe2+ transport system protein FeoA